MLGCEITMVNGSLGQVGKMEYWISKLWDGSYICSMSMEDTNDGPSLIMSGFICLHFLHARRPESGLGPFRRGSNPQSPRYLLYTVLSCAAFMLAVLIQFGHGVIP
jgi:hypothetical protein